MTSEASDEDQALRLAGLEPRAAIPPMGEAARSELGRQVRAAGAAAEPARTLVFWDLEATGLRGAYPHPRILELACVAVDVDVFEAFGRQLDGVEPELYPRVLNKLTLTFRVAQPIDNLVTDLTGLDNLNLEHQPPLTADSVALMSQFLARLPQPLVLLAHNGHGYDVPLLLAELRRVQVDPAASLPYPVLDTWRSLQAVYCPEPRPSTPPHAGCGAAFEADFPPLSPATHRETLEGGQTPSVDSTPVKSAGPGRYQIPLTPPRSAAKRARCGSGGREAAVKPTPLPFEAASRVCHLGRKLAELGGLSPPPPAHLAAQAENEITPDKGSPPFDRHRPPRAPLRAPHPGPPARTSPARARKRLDFNRPPSFKLAHLHEHLFGHRPHQSHGAEADCLTLLRVCARHAPALLARLPQDAQPMGAFAPMW
eukprot:snap_masked-scaffold278_size225338-processed-gene-1.15 protein:Tk03822 transcript:snap_masked-scaffold278_size225338-processed-gene-1.15-mRNA-1 annotation:"three prime repair exonuclease"